MLFLVDLSHVQFRPDALVQTLPHSGTDAETPNKVRGTFIVLIRHDTFIIRHGTFIIRKVRGTFIVRHGTFIIRHGTFIIRHHN